MPASSTRATAIVNPFVVFSFADAVAHVFARYGKAVTGARVESPSVTTSTSSGVDPLVPLSLVPDAVGFLYSTVRDTYGSRTTGNRDYHV